MAVPHRSCFLRQPLSEVESVTRISAAVARWRFTTAVTAVDDSAGLEVNGGSPGTFTLSSDALSIDANYGSGVTVGSSWILDDGSIETGPGVVLLGQNGRVA